MHKFENGQPYIVYNEVPWSSVLKHYLVNPFCKHFD